MTRYFKRVPVEAIQYLDFEEIKEFLDKHSPYREEESPEVQLLLDGSIHIRYFVGHGYYHSTVEYGNYVIIDKDVIFQLTPYVFHNRYTL